MEGEPFLPVVLKDAGFRAPEASDYYVLARNGLFLERHTDIFSASVPVEGGVPGLAAHEPRLTLRLPRLPRAMLERAMGFFRAVWERWEGEAILLIFYAPAAGDRPSRFAFGAPPQRIRGRFERGRFRADLRLEYGACERPGPEFRKLGTFHSHGHVGPAHSSTDEHDELFETGLHLTAGYVDSRLPAFAATFVVGRTRFPLEPRVFLPVFRAPRRPPAAWLAQVTVVCESWGGAWGGQGSGWTGGTGESHRNGSRGAPR
jgi:hypothetical protein